MYVDSSTLDQRIEVGDREAICSPATEISDPESMLAPELVTYPLLFA